MENFIKENYHTHTWRCQHAEGTEREYVETAIRMGIRVLGFADHVPCPFKDGYISGIRMTMEQAPGYVETIRALGEEYKGQIELKVGFETEYKPEFYPEQMQMMRELGGDYMIIGQHFTGKEGTDPYMGDRLIDTGYLTDYVDLILEGAATGSFLYVAHPDIIRFEGNPGDYEREMLRLCEGLKKLDVPVEINMLGIRGKRHYPTERFWAIAGAVGNRTMIGMDAHDIAGMTDVAGYQAAVRLAQKYHLELLN